MVIMTPCILLLSLLPLLVWVIYYSKHSWFHMQLNIVYYLILLHFFSFVFSSSHFSKYRLNKKHYHSITTTICLMTLLVGGHMSYLTLFVFCLRVVVPDTCCVFVLFVFVLCLMCLCCRFLSIVQLWLPLRCALTLT